MSWDQHLFAVLDELEQQAESLFTAGRGQEVLELGRAEYSQVTLASRLMASADRQIGLEVIGVGPVSGVLERLGAAWCLVRGDSQDWVIRAEAIAVVHQASLRSVPEVAWSPVHQLGFASALRRVAETGERCLVHRLDGVQHDVRLRRVGADFVEAVAGQNRTILLGFSTIAAIQSRD
ncbi:MAG: hypothetical protein ACRCYQ_02135 [Nocardioides sp.]